MRIRINLLNKKGGVIYSHNCKNNNTRITVDAAIKNCVDISELVGADIYNPKNHPCKTYWTNEFCGPDWIK